jgi:flagellar hook-associated protein 2
VGKPKIITVATDKTALKTSINNFVLDFNALKSVMDSLSSYDSVTGDSAQLQGDSTLRALKNEIRSITGNTISNLSGKYSSLKSIGLSLSSNNDGKLNLDEVQLDKALAESFDTVGKLFAATAAASDSLVEYSAHTKDTKPGNYALNVTQLATQGSLTVGATLSSFVVGANNDTFSMSVDGITSGEISLTQKDYVDGASLAAEIQNRINSDVNLKGKGLSVAVVYDTDHFVMTSNRYGSVSKVEILSVENGVESGNIGLVVGAGNAGVDVAGTINGVGAVGSGKYLSSSSGDSHGLKVKITGGILGDRGTIAMSRGYVDRLNTALEAYTKDEGLLKIREKTLNDKLVGYAEDSTKLDTRYEALLTLYRIRFSTLNALLGKLNSQSEWMKTSFEGLSGNN